MIIITVFPPFYLTLKLSLVKKQQVPTKGPVREPALSGHEKTRKGRNNMNIYGVYDVKTDLPVCVGSIYDCCNYLGIKPVSFRCVESRQRAHKQSPKKYKILKLYREDK